MLDRALMQRLETKAQIILENWHRNGNDWEETCYQHLCKNFGFKVNAEPFLQLAQSLPYKFVLKHVDKQLQVESLLFGMAGFLGDNQADPYHQLLKREFDLLQQKYKLSERKLKSVQWRFLRLRPANFPTVRLAQFAALLHMQKNIFSKIVSSYNFREVKEIFKVRQSAYWQGHYQFGKTSTEVAALGEVSIENILVNTVVPILAAYSLAKDDPLLMDRAVSILQHLKAEANVITRQWVGIGIKCKTAFDSQALIELNNNFCLRRRCLECTIGASLINPSSR
jgi:hypothetical protein